MSVRAAAARRVELLLGYACPYRCEFCMESERLETLAPHALSLDEARATLAACSRAGVERVSICGSGEPAAHPALAEVLREARGQGLRTEVFSNGLIGAGRGRAALAWVDDLWLSLHGDTPELHDAITGRPGSYARLLRAFRRARFPGGPRLGAAIVVCARNAGRVQAIMRLAVRSGAKACILSQVVPMGRGGARYADFAVPYAWWGRSLGALVAEARSLGLRLECSGLPLCCLGEHRALSRESSLPAAVCVERVIEGGRPRLSVTQVASGQGDGSRALPHPSCAPCASRRMCVGLTDAHLAAFGERDVPFAPGRGA